MKSLIRVVLAAVLCGAASPAASQHVSPPLIPSVLEPLHLAADGVPGGSSVADPAVSLRLAPPGFIVEEDRWDAPLLGLVAGAAIGGLLGYWAEQENNDGIAPPAYYISVPLGAMVGFWIGLQRSR